MFPLVLILSEESSQTILLIIYYITKNVMTIPVHP